MKSYIDAKSVDPGSLTYRQTGPWKSSTPQHMRRALRLEIPRSDLEAMLEGPYAEGVAELRADIIKSGQGPDAAERAALSSPTLANFLDQAPHYFLELLEGLLWRDLRSALFDRNPEPQWRWVVDALDSATFTAELCILEGLAYAVQSAPVRP